jgi:hypothetical protein
MMKSESTPLNGLDNISLDTKIYNASKACRIMMLRLDAPSISMWCILRMEIVGVLG